VTRCMSKHSEHKATYARTWYVCSMIATALPNPAQGCTVDQSVGQQPIEGDGRPRSVLLSCFRHVTLTATTSCGACAFLGSPAR
jgi:hypothetical protein